MLARNSGETRSSCKAQQTLPRAGKYSEATYEAGQLVDKASSGPFHSFAMYSPPGAVAADEKLPASERTRLADQYADRQLLTSASPALPPRRRQPCTS